MSNMETTPREGDATIGALDETVGTAPESGPEVATIATAEGKEGEKEDEGSDPAKRKRNRAAVRNYRARKKAYIADLEQEVKQLRATNSMLLKKVYQQSEMEKGFLSQVYGHNLSQNLLDIMTEVEQEQQQQQQQQQQQRPQTTLVADSQVPLAHQLLQLHGGSGPSALQGISPAHLSLLGGQPGAPGYGQMTSSGQTQAPPAQAGASAGVDGTVTLSSDGVAMANPVAVPGGALTQGGVVYVPMAVSAVPQVQQTPQQMAGAAAAAVPQQQQNPQQQMSLNLIMQLLQRQQAQQAQQPAAAQQPNSAGAAAGIAGQVVPRSTQPDAS